MGQPSSTVMVHMNQPFCPSKLNTFTYHNKKFSCSQKYIINILPSSFYARIKNGMLIYNFIDTSFDHCFHKYFSLHRRELGTEPSETQKKIYSMRVVKVFRFICYPMRVPLGNTHLKLTLLTFQFTLLYFIVVVAVSVSTIWLY